MSELVAQMNIRVPSEVRDWLERKAREEERSMNRIILRALKEAMAREEVVHADENR